MNCPVCNRNLAPTLSICLTCGAMINDSVREELQTKITVNPKPIRFDSIEEEKIERSSPNPPVEAELSPPVIDVPLAVPPRFVVKTPATPKPVPTAKSPAVTARSAPVSKRVLTTELNRQKTSPTLIEFQNKNAAVPDWRLQLQNVVRQRRGSENEAADKVYRKHVVTSGANALQPEYVSETAPAPEPEHKDPRVAKALERIATSRKYFSPPDEPAAAAGEVATPRNFPFNVVSRTAAPTQPQRETVAKKNVPPKPRLVTSIKMEKKALDTNKLPPIPDELLPPPAVEVTISVESPSTGPETVSRPLGTVSAELVTPEAEKQEMIDDLPPVSMRFGAGLFDMIIGGFTSLVLLLPLVFMGGDWFSVAGLLAFIPTFAITMFIYMTASLGFYGRTFGMRLFALELIDAEENEYPTLHQAAVSSSLYLISLALAGAGFLTMLFNDERRAIHDLLSGTIMVKEF